MLINVGIGKVRGIRAVGTSVDTSGGSDRRDAGPVVRGRGGRVTEQTSDKCETHGRTCDRAPRRREAATTV